MLPISKIFELRDLVLFHKIVNGHISFNLPEYIKKFDGASRLRNNNLDSECYICHIDYKQKICASSRNQNFRNYFYRTAHLWNKLPYSIRINPNVNVFKQHTTNFFWDELCKKM